ncbi:hypothetical protein N9F27_02790 [Crocinitomicaceae bacterium]|jgi:hypothetical protein|nr:hypothetical protein [Crocinitomicaceae bacterium]
MIKKEQVQYDYLMSSDGNGGSTYTPLYVSHWAGFVAEIPDSIYRAKLSIKRKRNTQNQLRIRNITNEKII